MAAMQETFGNCNWQIVIGKTVQITSLE